MAGFEPAIYVFQTAVNRDTCIVQDTSDSAGLRTARHGQFQEKEKKLTTELNISPSKFFSDEKQ